MTSSIVTMMRRLHVAFEDLQIPYLVGGSVAATVYGEPRYTQDVDIGAVVRMDHASPLAAALCEEFYVDEEMIRDAVAHQSSFNVIFLETTYKADIFVLPDDGRTRSELQRRRLRPILPGSQEAQFFVASPEDNVLRKLEWYRATGGTSEKQWRDILGVLKTQRTTLETPYLKEWAAVLKLSDLLAQALDDAGISGP